MWIVVYMTQVQATAETLCDLLRRQGILVKLRDISKNKKDSASGCYEILVTESESEEAHNIIIEAGF